MTSLFPAGAGDQGPKGPIREPLHPDERDGSRFAPKPPSERGTQSERPPGVGVFRYAGCGLGATIALVAMVSLLLGLGYLRDDPSRNPAPAGYATAVCTAFEQLGDGVDALQRGVEASAGTGRTDAARDVERAVEDANATLVDLPTWDPGRSIDELLGSQIITLTNGFAALADGTATEDLRIAREVDEIGREQLASGRYGFTC